MLKNVKQTETVKPVKVNLADKPDKSTFGGFFLFISW